MTVRVLCSRSRNASAIDYLLSKYRRYKELIFFLITVLMASLAAHADVTALIDYLLGESW